MCCTGLWRGKPHSEFFEGSCDQYANYEWIIPKENERTLPPEQVHDKLLVFFTPATGAAYFQHFIDRGFSALMQVWYVLFCKQYIFLIFFFFFFFFVTAHSFFFIPQAMAGTWPQYQDIGVGPVSSTPQCRKTLEQARGTLVTPHLVEWSTDGLPSPHSCKRTHDIPLCGSSLPPLPISTRPRASSN